MCRAADTAMAMVNKSIEMAVMWTNDNYYMNFVKLHKLMYLAQCSMLSEYGRPLFRENISAHECGPYVEGLHFIPRKRGFGLIQKKFSEADFITPSYRRMEVIETVLEEFGARSTAELIQHTKGTVPYAYVADMITESYKPIISQESMAFSTVQNVT